MVPGCQSATVPKRIWDKIRSGQIRCFNLSNYDKEWTRIAVGDQIAILQEEAKDQEMLAEVERFEPTDHHTHMVYVRLLG